MSPVVSVITVSYNAEAVIEKTIQSVLCQSYTSYEYIFIDGNSKDDTVAVIESYRDRFEARGISYRVTSEPDGGIYDAMNKGICQAEGSWVIMLNAGDCFADSQVLNDVFSMADLDGKILYGDTILKYVRANTAYYKSSPASPAEKMQECLPFCHQSVFVPGELLKEYAFDTGLRLAADYKFFVQAYKAGKRFLHVPRFISIYDCSGISSTNHEKLAAEYDVIKKELFADPKPNPEEWQKNAVNEAIKNIIKAILPGIVYSKARGWYKTPDFYKNRESS